jgi:hypothetical protein
VCNPGFSLFGGIYSLLRAQNFAVGISPPFSQKTKRNAAFFAFLAQKLVKKARFPCYFSLLAGSIGFDSQADVIF